MDMFPDVEHVRDMQRELDQIIQSSVINITKLVHNSETTVSSGVAEDGEDEFEMKRRVQLRMNVDNVSDSDEDDDRKSELEKKKPVKPVIKSGQRLTEQLVKQGLLTKSMLRQIQQELVDNISKDDDTNTKS